MDKLSVNARRAIKNYGEDVCMQAYKLFSENARAIRGVGYDLDLTLAQANAAINAGRELKDIEASKGFADNTLADIKEKLEELPATAVRSYQGSTIAALKDIQIVGRAVRVLVPVDPDDAVITLSNEAFDRVTEIIECDQPTPALKALMSRTPSWGSSAITLDAPVALPRYMKSFHRVRRYNRLNLSLDAWKVIATHHRHYVYTYEAALAQDARVCAIEQELWQYEGLKRTPVRDRRVKKLVKILKRLKRGLYE